MSRQERKPGSGEFIGLFGSELRAVREALCGMQFGSVVLIVQDGVIIQVNRTRILTPPNVKPPLAPLSPAATQDE